jgi:hypothetical protein
MITEDHYNDLEMASLAFVHQEVFEHPEIEEVMQEVFTNSVGHKTVFLLTSASVATICQGLKLSYDI